MYKGKKILGIIPARGGSKGVLNKNIRLVADKPLIAWTIEEGKKSQYIDRLIVSSDSTSIIEVAIKWNCEVPFVRPSELSKDDTPSIALVLHAIDMLPDYNYVVLLQPTSPLRKVQDIDECIRRCIDQEANSCVSITEAQEIPYWMYRLNDNGRLAAFIEQKEKPLLRRQDAPAIYVINGAVYVGETNFLQANKNFISPDTIGYIMSREASIDLDTEYDFMLLETKKEILLCK